MSRKDFLDLPPILACATADLGQMITSTTVFPTFQQAKLMLRGTARREDFETMAFSGERCKDAAYVVACLPDT